MTDQSAPTQRAAWATQDPLLLEYYDTEWGDPITDEVGVFERLTLEAFQSGLSWLTVLRKRQAFREAFDGFDPRRIAAYDDGDVERLLSDSGIIRNSRKIHATIGNARATLQLAAADGPSLAELVWSYMPERSPAPATDAEVPATSPESVELARVLKRHGFSFVGPTTVYALMTAIGIADGHLVTSPRRGCSGLWNIDGSRTDAPAPFAARGSSRAPDGEPGGLPATAR
ncbi:DNA-3-methyladenine glycosylase I [Leucobacter luti]|uniref:DNA-3-methyladenine glycosylase I n=1 Tax=Leucobacter luti TaxID=340320 RepID=A0A4Q7TX03_9MICO|nr:DNA-3-methyladenine glycosylase I [Leucobacter luti]MBL3698237.1 DNA-3-methyladenine glycosylase I [Leucobacter luti]RZT64680.1 DNA-3-methyladenine glycosylase I [Leucobacter luti]